MRIRLNVAGAKWAVWIFAVIAVLLFIVAGLVLARSVLKISRGERTQGVVVDNAISRSAGTRGVSRRTTYAPIVAFEIERGGKRETIRFRDWLATGSPHPIGATVPVLYDPADPSSAVIPSFVNFYLFPIIFGGIGLIFGGVAFVVRRVARAALADALASFAAR